jgi:fused signal recognition particle receptor
MGFITLFGSPEPRNPTVIEKVREKVRNATSKTREQLRERLSDLVRGKREIDADLLDELEAILIGADIGVETTASILASIRDRVSRQALKDPSELHEAIREELGAILKVDTPPPASVPLGEPFVILVVGVNGVGKTTTIGKLARRFTSGGKTVMLAASDTFRAAAIEQLEVWAERVDVPIVRQGPGSDPSAVLFDTLRSARARGMDYVIVDTAGRLHTKQNLMAELGKMTRIASREVPGAPHEVLLVLDATTGQNGLIQAREFTRTAALTGLVLTKLDGTARGGIVVSIVRELGVPIRFLGTGEQADDLVEFDATHFVDSLFPRDS